jgi:hypothetical protein
MLIRQPGIPKVIASVLKISSRASSESIKCDILSQTYRIIARIATNIQKAFSKAEDYERASRLFFDSKIVEYMIDHLKDYLVGISANPDSIGSAVQAGNIVKSLEFFSSYHSGIELLFYHIEETLQVIKLCFDQNHRCPSELAQVAASDQRFQPLIQNVEILYSGATILLDLSANE